MQLYRVFVLSLVLVLPSFAKTNDILTYVQEKSFPPPTKNTEVVCQVTVNAEDLTEAEMPKSFKETFRKRKKEHRYLSKLLSKYKKFELVIGKDRCEVTGHISNKKAKKIIQKFRNKPKPNNYIVGLEDILSRTLVKGCLPLRMAYFYPFEEFSGAKMISKDPNKAVFLSEDKSATISFTKDNSKVLINAKNKFLVGALSLKSVSGVTVPKRMNHHPYRNAFIHSFEYAKKDSIVRLQSMQFSQKGKLFFTYKFKCNN